MKAYWAIVNVHFRVLLQYRAAAVAGLATQFFWGMISVAVFGAFYSSTTHTQPMSYPQVVTYIWLGQAMVGMQPWNVDTDVRQMIRSGTMAYELLRPLDLYGLWFARALAQRTAPTLLRAVPLLMIAGLFMGLKPPSSFASGCAAIGSIASALLLSCELQLQ